MGVNGKGGQAGQDDRFMKGGNCRSGGMGGVRRAGGVSPRFWDSAVKRIKDLAGKRIRGLTPIPFNEPFSPPYEGGAGGVEDYGEGLVLCLTPPTPPS